MNTSISIPRKCAQEEFDHRVFSSTFLKYGFCNKSFWKDEPLTSWTLLQHICLHFWAWLLNKIEITPKSEEKYVVKVFNWSEVHFSEMTYKIHTLWEWTHIGVFLSLCYIKMSPGACRNKIHLSNHWLFQRSLIH